MTETLQNANKHSEAFDDNEIQLNDSERLILSTLESEYSEDIECEECIEDAGWRNKYKIHLKSGVPQKKVYSENGPIHKLLQKGLLERRKSPSKWGCQRFQFRYSSS